MSERCGYWEGCENVATHVRIHHETPALLCDDHRYDPLLPEEHTRRVELAR